MPGIKEHSNNFNYYSMSKMTPFKYRKDMLRFIFENDHCTEEKMAGWWMDDGLQWKQGNQSGSHYKSLCEKVSGKAGDKLKKKQKKKTFWMPN